MKPTRKREEHKSEGDSAEFLEFLSKPGSLAPPGHKINSGERFVIKLYFESVFPTRPAHNVRTLSPSSLPFPSTRGQDF